MSNKIDNFIERERKFPGLGLLQNPKCTKRTKDFFKSEQVKDLQNCDLDKSLKTSPIDDFRAAVINKVTDLEFPLAAHDRCDPIKVLLEAAYFQYMGRSYGSLSPDQCNTTFCPTDS
jgi:hypothetical protein